MSKWIKVEERIPLGLVLVNVCDDGFEYFDIAYWYVDGDCWVNNDNQRVDGVTHWMKLPKSPSEQGE